MKISTFALFALGTLAAAPAWAQQAYSSSSTTTTTTTYPSASSSSTYPPAYSSSGAYPSASAGTSGTVRPTYLSPGEPLAAAQTTQAYVPNRDVVVAVEKRLSQLGYNVDQSGEYNASLRNNVLRFQSDTGLRPTGDVDLSTIGALGINVQPTGQMTAMAPTTVTTQQTAQVNDRFDFPLERNDHMSSPQVKNQSTEWESTTGITLSPNEIQVGQQPPGFPPGFPLEDLY